MKKLLALALSLVLLFTMAAPTMAAGGEDAVSPDALCNGNHVLYEANTSTTYTWVNNSTCHVIREIHYMCQRCYYYEDDTEVYDTSHSSYITGARCNGSTQTIDKACSNCKHSIGYTTKACPGAYHTGTCLWLPI